MPNDDGAAVPAPAQTTATAAQQLAASIAAPPAAQPAATGDDAEGQPPPARRYTTADVPEDALQQRLKRERDKAAEETRKALLAELGITDPAAFKARLTESEKELARFKAEEEKRKRASMTEAQRIQKDLEQERAQRQQFEQRVKELEETQVQVQQQMKLESIARQHIDAEEVGAAVEYHFERHLRTLDSKAIAALDDRAIDRWFRDLAKRKPQLARKVAPTPEEEAAAKAAAEEAAKKAAAAQQRPVVKRPITAPAPRNPSSTAVGNGAGVKTSRPGQANSKTKEEVRAEFAAMGITSYR